ncbi:MAG TPA: 4Fe-4S binding protein [Phycisphaerae bacterium]|nr:4Fe-4S binding protein [Phycisphaerae bacterium]
MIANYGYKDGSGDYFIAIDTDKCDGCGDCVPACPNQVFVVGEDPNDPLCDEPVAMVGEQQRKKLKYTCAPCKPDHDRPPLPCVQACKPLAISHSW